MDTYLSNKAVSISLPIALLITLVFIFGDGAPLWRALLVVAFLLGYTHYFLGGFYQLKSYAKREKAYSFYLLFSFLTLLSLVLVYGAYRYELMPLLGLLTIPYFVLHGLLNEETLMSRSGASPIPRTLFLGIALFAIGISFLGFFHPSAYFTPTLEFLTAFQSARYIASVPTWIPDTLSAVAWGVTLLSIGILFKGYVENRSRVTFIFLIVAGVIATTACVSGPPNYIFIQFLLLMYHFITWMVFFGVSFYKKGIGFTPYVLAHLAIMGTALASFLVPHGTGSLGDLVFNANIFIAFTTIHITTSFLNEAWFSSFLLRIIRI